jgi:hypothetical protein
VTSNPRLQNRSDKTKLLGTTNFPYLRGVFAVEPHCANNRDEPFGFPTVITSKGPLPMNWEDLQSQINMEQAAVAQCSGGRNLCASRAATRCRDPQSRRTAQWHSPDRPHQSCNQSCDTRPQQPKNGKLDTAPAQGTGDCKQYSVLKYVALTNVEFAREDLRIRDRYGQDRA